MLVLFLRNCRERLKQEKYYRQDNYPKIDGLLSKFTFYPPDSSLPGFWASFLATPHLGERRGATIRPARPG